MSAISAAWTNEVIWGVAAASAAGVVLRPRRWPEAVWAVGGALVVALLGLLPWGDVLRAAAKGTDVYLFLTGMMLLSELARLEGLFDRAAAWAVRRARGSATRLFALVYAIGTVVTVLLSNDATAVVLTPAVYAAARQARARPLPYLMACALIANAASFVLPISNPANLVVYGTQLPPLGAWLLRFGLASLGSIAVTYAVLRWRYAGELAVPIERAQPPEPMSGVARWTAFGLGCAALVLVTASSLGWPLGAPTLAAAALTLVLVAWRQREMPWAVLRGVSWGVLPLVAGLFVLVEAVDRTGVLRALAAQVQALASQHSPTLAAWVAGLVTGFGCNLMNNLPAGLVAASVAHQAGGAGPLHAALAVGIDLGPNLSVTGSLATILWLAAIRREGEHVSGLQFLRVGLLAMPLALGAALALLLAF
jgi:arsenical pump membrane protein